MVVGEEEAEEDNGGNSQVISLLFSVLFDLRNIHLKAFNVFVEPDL